MIHKLSGRRSLTEKEIRAYRFTFLLASIITPAFSYLWINYHSNLSIIKVLATIFTIYFTTILFLSFKNTKVKAQLDAYLIPTFYLVSGYVIFLGYNYNFSEGYSILIFLVVFNVIFAFNAVKELIYYLTTVMIFFAIALFSADIQYNDKIIMGVSYLVFIIVSILNIYIRAMYQKALDVSYRDYQRFLDSIPEGVIVHDNMKILYINPAAMKLNNGEDMNDFIGRSIFDYVDAGFHEQLKKEVEDFTVKGETKIVELSVRLANNKLVEIETINTFTQYKGRNVVMATLRDISERKAMERKIKDSELKYRSLVEGALVGVYVFQEGKVIYVNPYIEEMIGYSSEEICNMDFLQLIYPEDRELLMNAILALKGGCNELSIEARLLSRGGGIIYIQLKGNYTCYNELPAITGTVINITGRREAEIKVNNLAFYDVLTELPNRNLLNDFLKKSILQSQKENTNLAVLFVDLDRFKIVNDTMGHSFGDLLLQKSAKRLKESVRKGDFLARYGGDEFLVVLSDITHEEIESVCKNIVTNFNASFNINSNEVYISPSIGISQCPVDCVDAEALIKYADTAMYLAKTQGRNTYRFYFEELNSEVSRKMKLEIGLRRALDNEELTLYYQPKIELSSGKIVSVEALIRWRHPELGIVSPLDFIPLAEETGLIIPIGNWVLKNACIQSKLWQKEGLTPISISVNVSGVQLKESIFIDTLKCILEETGLEAKYLELEITESILKDIDTLKPILNNIRSLGVSLAVDDFGVGYSSLSVLQNMPMNILKIDQSFIKGIGENAKAAAIVGTIVEMGKHLNISVVAEGIETTDQLQVLQVINCGLGQGYLFSRPITSSDFQKLLKEDQKGTQNP